MPKSGKVKVPSELEFVRKPPLSLSFPLGFEEIVMDRILPGISGFEKSMIFPYNFFPYLIIIFQLLEVLVGF